VNRFTFLAGSVCLLTAPLAAEAPPAGAPMGAQERGAVVVRGQALFTQKGCSGCHRIGDVGARLAPDLSHVGTRFREEDLARWLGPSAQEPPTPARGAEDAGPAKPGPTEPSMSRPAPHMPTPRLSEDEAQALAAYLASLR
jgi:mono/diheme cytochrome c family protein